MAITYLTVADSRNSNINIPLKNRLINTLLLKWEESCFYDSNKNFKF